METKQDFINGLRRALTGKISAEEVEEHIRYYEEYITVEGRAKGSERVVLDMLGDPKLIAMSICAAGAAGERDNDAERGFNYSEQNIYEEERSNDQQTDGRSFILRHPKLTIIMILAVILLVLILILALVFSLLKLLWPVLLVIVLAVLVVRLIVFLQEL